MGLHEASGGQEVFRGWSYRHVRRLHGLQGWVALVQTARLPGGRGGRGFLMAPRVRQKAWKRVGPQVSNFDSFLTEIPVKY
jgi:hypothetical protein